MELTPDTVVQAVTKLLNLRSLFGLKKYGMPLDKNPAPRAERVQHALEEAADLTNYLMWEKMALDKDPVDARIQVMSAALEAAAAQFEFYQREHNSKAGKGATKEEIDSRLDKAEANMRWAMKCREAIVKTGPTETQYLRDVLNQIASLCEQTWIGKDRAFTALSTIHTAARKALAG